VRAGRQVVRQPPRPPDNEGRADSNCRLICDGNGTSFTVITTAADVNDVT
jgi:hypothetical protein